MLTQTEILTNAKSILDMSALLIAKGCAGVTGYEAEKEFCLRMAEYTTKVAINYVAASVKANDPVTQDHPMVTELREKLIAAVALTTPSTTKGEE